MYCTITPLSHLSLTISPLCVFPVEMKLEARVTVNADIASKAAAISKVRTRRVKNVKGGRGKHS